MKICILEDEDEDAIRRYSDRCPHFDLTGTPHDVHVVLAEDLIGEYGSGFPPGEREEFGRTYISNKLSKAGFKPENIHYADRSWKDIPIDADVYFCDGLRGACFSIAERLGKNKVFINSTNMGIEERARKQGFRLLEGTLELEEILSEFEHK